MTEILTAALDDPLVKALLDGLEAEYLAEYGASVAADLGAYDAGGFLPPTGALLLAVAGTETVAGVRCVGGTTASVRSSGCGWRRRTGGAGTAHGSSARWRASRASTATDPCD